MKRFIRIALSTASMYILTHLIVFALLPVGIVLAQLKQEETLYKLKPRFVDALFFIVGKKMNIRGLETIEPGQGYVIVSNYPSFYTMFVLMKIFPQAQIVAQAFIVKIPLLGQFMKQIGAIFVDPKKGRSTEAIGQALSQADGVKHIIILPEGGRTPDGGIHRFRRGFVYILRHSKLALLPVTLNGFYRLKPVKRFYMDPDTELEVIIHKPIEHSEIDKTADKILIEKTEKVVVEAYLP